MKLKLLIASNHNETTLFQSGPVSRALKDGLSKSEISWVVHDPLLPDPDLRAFDVMLSWHYRIPGDPGLRQMRIVELEEECQRFGVPVVNAIRKRARIKHSFCLRRWKELGIRCAEAQKFTELREIQLSFPLMLRVDGGSHSAQDSCFAENLEAARQIQEERHVTGRRRLDLAIEFIDTRSADGYYRKRRSFVVGETLIPRQHMLSANWKVKLGSSVANADAVAEDKSFMTYGERQEALVRRAARVLGCDILALDYSPDRHGNYVFWEANRSFRMAGIGNGPKSLKFRAATGRSHEQCLQQRSALGAAIVDLIYKKGQRENL